MTQHQYLREARERLDARLRESQADAPLEDQPTVPLDETTHRALAEVLDMLPGVLVRQLSEWQADLLEIVAPLAHARNRAEYASERTERSKRAHERLRKAEQRKARAGELDAALAALERDIESRGLVGARGRRIEREAEVAHAALYEYLARLRPPHTVPATRKLDVTILGLLKATALTSMANIDSLRAQRRRIARRPHARRRFPLLCADVARRSS